MYNFKMAFANITHIVLLTMFSFGMLTQYPNIAFIAKFDCVLLTVGFILITITYLIAKHYRADYLNTRDLLDVLEKWTITMFGFLFILAILGVGAYVISISS